MKLVELADKLRDCYFQKLKEGGDTDEYRVWTTFDLDSIKFWKAVALKANQLLQGKLELEYEYLSYWETYTAINREPVVCSSCLGSRREDETVDKWIKDCRDCTDGCELEKLPCGCLLAVRRAFKYSDGNEVTIDDDAVPIANTVVSVGLYREVNCKEDHFKDQFYSPNKLGIFR